MLNQTVLVGRLVEKPIIEETENGEEIAIVKLAVPRSFKNSEGEYETDFIPCILWNGVANTTCEYCHKGDLIGIKGRLQCTTGKVKVVAEKVTFLSSKQTEEA